MKRKTIYKTVFFVTLAMLPVGNWHAAEGNQRSYNTAVQLTEDMIQEMNDGEAVLLYDEDGYLSFLDGRFYDQPVSDYEEAIEALNGVASLLGITRGCEFFAVYGSSDQAGYTYLNYKQRYGDETIENASLKIVLDPEGYPCMLSCSFAREIGTDPGESGITAEQAENQVRAVFWKKSPEILEEYTRRTTVMLDGIAYHAWEVYTRNMQQEKSDQRPYSKHIILYDGTYYKTLSVSSPEGYSDPDPAYSAEALQFFEELIPVPYTRTVTTQDGSRKTLSLTLGFEMETGMYYLADPGRKIASADFAARVYQNKYEMIRAENAGDLEDHDLLTFASYCKVYDYFLMKGKDSIDGFGIPLLLLSGYCLENGVPIDNAGFMGIQDGWGIFADSDVNHYGEAVDVVAHEYEHGIREYALGGDLYENRTGAIHEAYSDIIGNICEMELGATTDREWNIGEMSGYVLRRMSDPNTFRQPSFCGDRYYCEETMSPSDRNDQGGVHTNSGILGHIAYQIGTLGLSLDEQYWLWTISDELLTPCSDYDDVCAALLFVSKVRGYPDEVREEIRRFFSNALVLDESAASLGEVSGTSELTVRIEPEYLTKIAGLQAEDAKSGKVIRRVRADADGTFSLKLPEGSYRAVFLIYDDWGMVEPYYYDALERWNRDRSQAAEITLLREENKQLKSP